MTGEKQFGAALYELALDEKKEDAVLSGIQAVQKIFIDSPEYLKLLSNPAVPKNERLGLIESAFGDKIDRHAVSFIKILCERAALSALNDCVKEFIALLNNARGILPVTAECAVELTPEHKQRLSEKISAATGKTVQLSCSINPLLLGGVRLSYSGIQLDGTVQSRLEALKAALLA